MNRLGDIATYINGYAFKPSDWSNVGVPIIRIQDLTGNSYQANRYNGEYAKKYEVLPGDVLISWSASLGVYVWSGEKAVLNQHIFKVVFDKCDVDKSFFVHQVRNILEKAEMATHGATMKHLTKPVFDALPFYLPPFEEQQKISAVLDKVSDLIAKRRAQLDKLDLLVKARFVEMFGDPVRNDRRWATDTLDSLCDGIGDGLHGTPEYNENGEYPFINGNNLVNGRIVITPATKRINEEEYKRIYVEIGMNAVLISINGTLGKLALYHGEKVALGKSACYCNLRPEINRTFICGIMQSSAFSDFLESSSTKSTIKNVGLKAMREFKVILPPLDMQNQYSLFVEKVDKIKDVINRSLEDLETMKKALMQEYFG